MGDKDTELVLLLDELDVDELDVDELDVVEVDVVVLDVAVAKQEQALEIFKGR